MVKWCLKILPVIYLLFLVQISSVAADGGEGLKSHLSLGLGMERLAYHENEPDAGTVSDAALYNVLIDFEGLKRWNNIFCGITCSIPILRDGGNEEWYSSGNLYQVNSLKYGWTRINGYIGYPMTYWFNPFMGFRYSKNKQDRTDFVVMSDHRKNLVTERIRARYITTGVTGVIKWKPKWDYLYRIEYLYPASVSLINSAMPGWEVSDKRGHAFELKAGIEYLFVKSFSVSIDFTAGRVHWEGSDWKPYSVSLFKWPENTTQYLIGTFRINREF